MNEMQLQEEEGKRVNEVGEFLLVGLTLVLILTLACE